MRYSKQDLPKIVVLSVVLVGILAYIGVSYTRLSREHRARLQAEELLHRSMHESEPAHQASSGEQSPVTLAALLAPTPAPSRDPFYPVIPPRRAGAPAASQPSPRQTEAAAAERAAMRVREDVRLTGIVVGKPSIAVLRVGEDHHVVQEGDLVESGLRVQSIAATSVTMRDGEHAYVLRLGQ